MPQQISVEILDQGNSKVAVDVLEQQSAALIELTASSVAPVVEVLVPGPQGPTGPPGPAGVTTLQALQDVDVTNKTAGSILYYDAQRSKFVTDSLDSKINLSDGGNF